MGQSSSTCEQDRDFTQGHVFTRFDKHHQREQEKKRAGTLRQVSSCSSGLESTTTKKQRKSIHGIRSISNPSSPTHKVYSNSTGNSQIDQHVNIVITNNQQLQDYQTTSTTPSIALTNSPNSLSPATPQYAGSAHTRRRGYSSNTSSSNYFVNNNQTTQLMINQDIIELKKRNDKDSDDEEEDPATQRRSRRKSFSLFKSDKRTDMF